LRSNPGTVLNPDRGVSIWHLRLAKIVIARANEGALRDAAVRSNGYWFKIQDERLFPNPREITHSQLPRQMNIHSWFDDHTAANTCAKAAQDTSFDDGWNGPAWKKDYALYAIPCGFPQKRAATIQSLFGIKEIVANSGPHVSNGRHRPAK
jgi:hypothetical protein